MLKNEEGEYLLPLSIEFRAHVIISDLRQKAAVKADQLDRITEKIAEGVENPNLLKQQRQLDLSLQRDVNYLIISEAERVLRNDSLMMEHEIFPSEGAVMDLTRKAQEFTSSSHPLYPITTQSCKITLGSYS